jgi:hypothetical protein
LGKKPAGVTVATVRALRFNSACPNAPAPRKSPLEKCDRQAFRGMLIYCADYTCSHSTAISADQWPDHVRLSDLESRFVCKACGKRGADVRPDFNWNKKPVGAMGYR